MVTTSEKQQLDQKSKDLLYPDAYLNIKRAIWVYFLLILFEGALRKWFLPSLATPLLIVRDPVAIYIIVMAWQNKLIPQNFYLGAMVLFAIISSLTTLIVGHGNLPVTIYGARIFLIHFPLIFIIGQVFNRQDVLKVGKVVLWVSIPMIVLTALQFYSPQTAWVNRGVGGELGGAGFSGALGFYRPPGTFSFTNGTTLFFSLVACYVLYFWIDNNKFVNRTLLIIATAAVIIAIPLSISRTLLFQVIVSIIFTMFFVLRKPKYFNKFLYAIAGLAFVFIIISQADFFNTALEVFSTRIELASKSEGGLEGTLIDRFLGGLLKALTNSINQPIFGLGIGMGTNVGSKILVGEKTFLIAEVEWGRLIGEMGPILGLGVIILRVGLCFQIGIASFKQMRLGEFLPWILCSLGVLSITRGQWSQPTELGFSVFLGGLIVAALIDNRRI